MSVIGVPLAFLSILGRGYDAAMPARPRCRICRGPVAFRFQAEVLGGRYTARYHECEQCRALQVLDPTWLEEAYAAESGPPSAENYDSGRFRRTFSGFLYLVALSMAGALGEVSRVVDFGGGYGLLTQMLRDGAVDAWTSDPYVPRPFFSPDRSLPDLDSVDAGSVDVIVALEVFEHLTDPMAVGGTLRRALAPTGSLVISSERYRPERHGPDWPYLALATGQHVTFWSIEAREYFAAAHGFRSVASFPGDEGFLTVMSPFEAAELEEALTRAHALLNHTDFLNVVVGRWDFRSDGIVTEVPQPVVRGAALAGTDDRRA
jgi:SAM-dependent methyltransferase